MARLHTRQDTPLALVEEEHDPVRLVVDNKRPKLPTGRLRPYPPHLVQWLVDEVHWVGSWVRRMGYDRYRVERHFDAEHRKVVRAHRFRRDDGVRGQGWPAGRG